YKNLPNLMSYDVVINMQNIRFIHTWLFVFKFININRLVDWTIGTSTKNGLNRKITILDKMRDFLSKYSQAIILYTNYARFKYSKSNQNKIFIANNTVLNEYHEDLSSEPKNGFIFIGTLNKRKGIEILLEA